MFQPGSPIRRKESTPLLEKLKTDVAAARLKIQAALEKSKEEPKKEEKPKDESAMQRYIKTQVPCSLENATNKLPIPYIPELHNVMGT